jgi:uncharacterized protein
MSTPRTVSCPQCGKSVDWTPGSKWRPFCSERCKMIDLGAWATERYRVPTQDNDPDGHEPGDRGQESENR